MRTIKVKFVGFWPGFKPEELIIYRMLLKHYQVNICDDPDYIICSSYYTPYEYCKFPQVRLMMAEENYVPDFNLVDYAIAAYPIQFQDRYFYKPVCLEPYGHALGLELKDRKYDHSLLEDKQYFASFIASHESEHGCRGGFFKELSKYKRVESPGSYLNNMEGEFTVNYENESKVDFQRKCKFSLCFESTKHEGFITEKITDAFFADTIPIYYGSSDVSNIFNPKSFINVDDFNNWDDAIEYIKKVDRDDELYLSIMNQPILNTPNYFSNMMENLESFLLHIFEQPIESAYRRSRVYTPKRYEDYILQAKSSNYHEIDTLTLLKIVANRFAIKMGIKREKRKVYYPGRNKR